MVLKEHLSRQNIARVNSTIIGNWRFTGSILDVGITISNNNIATNYEYIYNLYFLIANKLIHITWQLGNPDVFRGGGGG